MEQNQKAKPDIEYFFGEPMSIYCGKCKRVMFMSTRSASVSMWLEHNDQCPWCKCEVDKEVDYIRHE